MGANRKLINLFPLPTSMPCKALKKWGRRLGQGTGDATARQSVWRVLAAVEEKEDHLCDTSNMSKFVE